VIDIRGSIMAKTSRKEADFTIEPKVGDIRIAELEKSSDAGERGVVEAYSRLDKVRESLMLFSMESLTEALGR
ncbi:MAG: hypothetical protein ABIG11_08005, partial [bacterium]